MCSPHIVGGPGPLRLTIYAMYIQDLHASDGSEDKHNQRVGWVGSHCSQVLCRETLEIYLNSSKVGVIFLLSVKPKDCYCGFSSWHSYCLWRVLRTRQEGFSEFAEIYIYNKQQLTPHKQTCPQKRQLLGFNLMELGDQIF